MLGCVRTTLNLPDGLAAEAKARAAASGRTFTSLVEEGLRLLLERSADSEAGVPAALPAYGEPDGRVLVDLSDRESVGGTNW
jgi:plasmid stability protein